LSGKEIHVPELNGFVFIIESPAAPDLLDGRTEGRVLSESLRIAEIPHWYSLAVDKRMFSEALGNRLAEAWRQYGRLPILHLSMHGNADGISLTSGEFMSWNELRIFLLPLIRAMRGGLLVCMSSCFGGAGCRMAMYLDNEPCFWALVGNKDSATWADAAIAYSAFYHLFFKQISLDICVASMRIASGDQNFEVHFGQHTRAGWQGFVNMHAAQLAEAVPTAAAEAREGRT
jgi:hypothetical protein